MTDSELVPWGKGEKHPGKGDEIVSETIRLQIVEAGVQTHGNGVPIEEWTNELWPYGGLSSTERRHSESERFKRVLKVLSKKLYGSLLNIFLHHLV